MTNHRCKSRRPKGVRAAVIPQVLLASTCSGRSAETAGQRQAPTVVQVGMLRDFQQRADAGQALRWQNSCRAIGEGSSRQPSPMLCSRQSRPIWAAAHTVGKAGASTGSHGRPAASRPCASIRIAPAACACMQQHAAACRAHLAALVVEGHAKEAGAAPRLLSVDQPLVDAAAAAAQRELHLSLPAGTQHSGPSSAAGVCDGPPILNSTHANNSSACSGNHAACTSQHKRPGGLTPWRLPSAWRTAPDTEPRKSAQETTGGSTAALPG